MYIYIYKHITQWSPNRKGCFPLQQILHQKSCETNPENITFTLR